MVETLAEHETLASRSLSGLWSLVKSRELLYWSFGETTTELLCQSPAALSAYLKTLDGNIDAIKAEPESGVFFPDSAAFGAWVADMRSRPSMSRVWRHADHWSVEYNTLEIVPFVLPADRRRVLHALDQLDFPQPICQVLTHPAIHHDRDMIVASLGDAPVASDDDRSWNGRLIAVLLLEAIEYHARDLLEVSCSPDYRGDVPDIAVEETYATLSAWLRDVTHVIMKRHDGRFLTSQWLHLKMHDARSQRARHPVRSNLPPGVLNEEHLFGWITHGVVAAGFTTDGLRSFVDIPSNADIQSAATQQASCPENLLDVDPSPLDTLTIMAELDRLSRHASLPLAGTRLEHLDVLLANRAPCFENEHIAGPDPHSLPARGCALLFAQHSDSADRWQQSWNAVFEQRRRAQHFRATNDAPALAPSLFLLACGVATVDELTVATVNRAAEARQLWLALFDALRDCWLTIPFRPLNESIEAFMVSLFQRHCPVFAPTLQRTPKPPRRVIPGYVDTLAQHFAFLGGDDLMITRCFVAVRGAGTSLSALALLLEWDNGRFAAALDQFERWEELAPPNRREPHLLHHLDHLRTAIQRSRSP